MTFDYDISFTYDANTEVHGSCAASLNGEMFVLGGFNQKRQVNIKKSTKIGQHSTICYRESYPDLINYLYGGIKYGSDE